MPEKIVGIIGGMGPEATADFYAKVIALTPAEKDQEHLHVIINSYPKIPDRTQSILNNDEKVVNALAQAAKILETAGADFIVIPCNTVHYFYDGLIANTALPVLNMIHEVVQAVQKTQPGCKRIGLLATTGTIQSNLYQAVFERQGIQVIRMNGGFQDRIMAAVGSIKAGRKEEARKRLLEAGKELIENGAAGLVLGCTEIPLAISDRDFTVPVYDSNHILAQATVAYALKDCTS